MTMNVEDFEEVLDGVFGGSKENEKGIIHKRQEYNRELIGIISDMVENYPQLRFGQILTILEVWKDDIDLFNAESFYTLKRVKAKYNLFKIL